MTREITRDGQAVSQTYVVLAVLGSPYGEFRWDAPYEDDDDEVPVDELFKRIDRQRLTDPRVVLDSEIDEGGTAHEVLLLTGWRDE